MIVKERTTFNYDLYFEAKKYISNEEEFKEELMNYCNKEEQSLTMIKNGMEPIVEINGEVYKCVLGEAFRTSKIPIFPVDLTGRFLGYKWVYLYKC